MATITASPRARLKRFWLRRLTVSLLSIALAFVGISWFFAGNLTGPKRHVVADPSDDFPFAHEAVTLTTDDGLELRGWHFPTENRKRAIVLLHGYGGDRRSMLPRTQQFRSLGFAVLAFDARACGESAGDRITFGLRESDDLAVALEWLRQCGYKSIVCLGVSQGGATILLGAEKLGDIRCVICESVFDTLEHAVDRRFRRYFGIPGWPASCLMVPIAEWRTGIAINDVEPVAHIGKLTCPVLVICGDADNRVYQEDTQALFDAAREPKELWVVPGAGHEDLFRRGGYSEQVTSFLKRHMP